MQVLGFIFELNTHLLRKTVLSLLILSCCYLTSPAQYWQQQVNYTIDVSLNDKDNTLDAFEKIEYINNSPDTLTFIWFHLWPNAYKNDKTAFSDQLLENGNTKFYFADKEKRGYINRLDFKVNDITVQTEDHPQHIDIIKIMLPTPLAPGQKTIISTPFHVKLPYNFSRGGHDGESYQATQWYPKPAVYDKNGWHPMPYLDQGEFYSEFGSFDVSITVPENYVVAATGELQNEKEKEWLSSRAAFNWEPLVQKEKMKSGGVKTVTQQFPPSSITTKTLRYKQQNVHDFAWFADKRFIVNTDTCTLLSGKIINVSTYYTPEQKEIWHESIDFAKRATRFYSREVGEYPYNVVQVVQGPESFGGGMEYPTITLISPTSSKKSLDITIAHEIGHNWFYGILGTNERLHPWMDEGINSYYEAKYTKQYYGEAIQKERIAFETKAASKTDQPIELAADQFTEINYGLSVYYKTAEWLRYIESIIGTTAFNTGMQEYYRQWKFKHPQPDDFKKAFEAGVGKNLDTLFSYLTKQGELPTLHRKGTATTFLFNFRKLKEYGKKPTKDLILFGPAIGANSYDKFMLGAFVTNIKLPPSRFQFLLAPMYATGSKKITGLGFAHYTFYPNHAFQKIETGVSAAMFTADQFTDDKNNKNFLGFRKIVPGLKFTFKEKNPKSERNRFIQFKTFLLNEDVLRFYRDTVISGIDTTITTKYNTTSKSRTLTQLQFVLENNRVLYPYRGELKIEQGKYFVRTAFTGNYFFNYPKGGGLTVRLFAGKFFYTSPKTFTRQFATDRYHLNMTGANGYEDYTYADYFIGRNKFEGFASQQIMVRDGGFKVRTDLLADKVGRTDDWLAALNFSTTLPKGINPLNLLPVKIPLKIFADIGTYAGPWKAGSDMDRFLFDAGFHIPLLKETINIYIPIIYSSVYKNYFESTIVKKERFWKKISFSIDISNFRLSKFTREF